MAKKSAGILMYRIKGGQPEVLLVHPGGPFWERKNLGSWSIPKGEFTEAEDPLAAARREFAEETGITVDGEFRELTPQTLKSGKLVFAWAVEGDLDPGLVKSNEFELEWPPKSGRRMMVPEVDRAEWFSLDQALEKINPGQAGFVRELAGILSR